MVVVVCSGGVWRWWRCVVVVGVGGDGVVCVW